MNSPGPLELEHRLRLVEDKLAIHELVASHPPNADTGTADYAISVYSENGMFDRGPTLDGAKGAKEIAAGQAGMTALSKCHSALTPFPPEPHFWLHVTGGE